MAKDLGGFMKTFAGSLGSQLGGGGGWNPLTGLMGGGRENREEEDNPGRKMFGMPERAGGNGFLEKFGGNLSDQLFQKAMMGFMGRGPS